MKVTLYAWPSADGFPSSSPFCNKVVYAARLKKVTPEMVWIADPRKMPSWNTRKKLPIAVIDGRQVQDSTDILQAMDAASPATARLYPEAPAERADTILLEDWADESLIRSMVYYRWAVDANFDRFSAQVFATMPALLRKVVKPVAQKRVKSRLAGQGILFFTEAERQTSLRQYVGCIEERLRSRAFLVRGEPTAADLAVLVQLEILVSGHIPETKGLLADAPLTSAWLKRMQDLVRA